MSLYEVVWLAVGIGLLIWWMIRRFRK